MLLSYDHTENGVVGLAYAVLRYPTCEFLVSAMLTLKPVNRQGQALYYSLRAQHVRSPQAVEARPPRT